MIDGAVGAEGGGSEERACPSPLTAPAYDGFGESVKLPQWGLGRKPIYTVILTVTIDH